MTAFIVRDVSEVRRAQAVPGAKLFFCTNKRTLDACVERSLDALLLDESVVREEYRGINTWALRMTFAFIEKFRSDRKKYVFAESSFMTIEAFFAQVLKDLLVLQKWVSQKKITRLAVFEKPQSLLAALCRHAASHLSVPVDMLPAVDSPVPAVPARERFKTFFYALAGAVMTAFSKTALITRRRVILVSGALNHLGGVVRRIREAGYSVVFCENEFNLEKFRFCLKHGVFFIVLPKAYGVFNPLEPAKRYFSDEETLYKGVSYAALLEGVFHEIAASGRLRFAFDYEALERFWSSRRFEAVLLDEEWAMRRMLSLFAKSSGTRCVVVSHGIPGMNLDATADSIMGKYECSTTVANSEFERVEFEGICYPPSRVVVSGVPRYDRIFQLKQRGKKTASKTVLYCGASMRPFDFEDMLPYLALGNFLYDSTEVYTKDILDVFSQRADVLLQIKPHYSQESVWEACIHKHLRAPVRYELLSHRDDTFRLVAEADLILTVESTVILEAILLDKPVVLLNYPKDELIVPYGKHGLVEEVHDKEALKKAVNKCLDDADYRKELDDKRRRVFQHYSGPFDGRNTERAAALVMSGHV